jgi:hypothetical protein
MGQIREVTKVLAGASAARDGRRGGHNGTTRAVQPETTAVDTGEEAPTGRALALYARGGSQKICLAPFGGGGGSESVVEDGSEAQWLDDDLPVDPAKLAEEVNFQYRFGQEWVVEHACHLGRILLHAREVVGHGGFQKWVDDNCDFKYRSATDYMKIARNWPEIERRLQQEDEPAAGFSLRWALDGVSRAGARRRAGSAPAAVASSQEAMVAVGDEGHARVTAPARRLALPAPRPAAAAVEEGEEDGSDVEDDEFIADDEVRGFDSDDEVGQGCDEPEDDEVPVSQSRRNLSRPGQGTDEAGHAGTGAADDPLPDPLPDPGRAADHDWLSGCPLWAQLEDTGPFAVDAALWRATRPAAEYVERNCDLSVEDFRSASRGDRYRDRFAYSAAAFVGVGHPRTWRLCQACKGRATSGPGRLPCGSCSGAGYWLTRRHDAFTRPAPASTGGQGDDDQTPGA